MSATSRPQTVRVGDCLPLHVEELAAGGEALARHEGLPVFIPFGVPGDHLVARIISTKPGYARALIERIIHPSPERVIPPCEVFGACGGCQWQMLGPAAQARWKTDLVRQSLKRIAGINPEGLLAECLPSPAAWNYRNKVHWAVTLEAGRWRLGLFEARSHRVVTASACAIQHPALTAAQHALEAVLDELDVLPYNEKQQTGFLRSAFAKVGHRSGELMVGLVTHHARFPQAAALVAGLRARLPNLHTVVQNIHPRAGNKLMGAETLVLEGPGLIHEDLSVGSQRPDLRLAISPVSFFQVNGAAVEILYDEVAKACGLPAEGAVGPAPEIIDAYGGTGAIALFLAARGAARVTGIEVVEAATADAQRNADVNALSAPARFIAGSVETLLGSLLAQAPEHTIVVLDPPRKGCEPAALDALLAHRPERIVYVSCNPATLARDLKQLSTGGYRLEKVQPVDMFPQTAHVECVASLRRAGGGEDRPTD